MCVLPMIAFSLVSNFAPIRVPELLLLGKELLIELTVLVNFVFIPTPFEPRNENLCENEGSDQLRSDCEADQRLRFRYTDSTIPPLHKAKIS